MSNSEQVNDFIDNYWLGLGDVNVLDLKGPLLEGLFSDPDGPPDKLFEIMQNPEYLSFVCKHFFNIEVSPQQGAILKELWTHPFPMLIASRGASKSFMLALYCLLRMFLHQGCKIVVVGAAFRQSKIIFEYMVEIWRNADIIKDICNISKDQSQGHRTDIDRCTFTLGKSRTIAIPIGDGGKIRGLRANYICADEFASLNKDIYENVIAGFAAVSSNPIQNMKNRARERAKKKLKIWEPETKELYIGNQAILSGTAYYAFNHFHEYWKRYREIVLSRGDPKKLTNVFPEGVPENFDHRDYCVIRVPVDLLPEGYMDEKHVARSKATVHNAIYQMEFGAIFCTDSDGFYKRSLIESCVAKQTRPIELASGPVYFPASLRGNRNCKYVYGIDPASENDKFSINVLEVHPDHRRIVYAWTTNRGQHKKVVENNLTKYQEFYSYCARKIRDLMKVFPTDLIGIDGQGGGVAIEEALHDLDKLEPGEQQIWPTIDPNKEKDTDGKAGLHILEIVQFADASWTGAANHGMRKDFEDKALLFPEFDPIVIGKAIHEDKEKNRLYDTLEDCYMEIEELKDELATIVHSQTGTAGRDRWDTPEVKISGGKKGRLRKDRYSALLIANMLARTYARADKPVIYMPVGGFANELANHKPTDGALYVGPDWFVQGMKGVY